MIIGGGMRVVEKIRMAIFFKNERNALCTTRILFVSQQIIIAT